jgi:hypothetical protein
MSSKSSSGGGTTGTSGGRVIHPMTGSDASRIQSAQAKSGGDMSAGGFSARAQRAAAHNANAGVSGRGSTTTGGKK